MQCPRCQHENPADMNFCGECGSRLAASCSACGAVNPPTNKFCGRCGASLQPTPATAGQAPAPARPVQYTPKHLADKILKSRSALEGERRQVTVLFADIAGFTSLSEKLDPEEVHQIIDRCFQLITAEVHRFEGTINQYTGDGVMALFGAPIAHEDGPRRAVHAALGIQRAIRDLSKELQTQRSITLQMRIGLNTGPVVVGKIGDDLRMDYTAVGDTTNIAARLQQNARPSSVLVSEATHRLIAGFFETLDFGEVPAKGHAPIPAFEVLRPRGRKARLDVAAERGLTPLVGRERELATLQELFEKVKRGHGQVVCIAGEAGIGKSRVVFEFRRSLGERGEDATWLEGRCVSFGQLIPLLPVIDQLRENFGMVAASASGRATTIKPACSTPAARSTVGSAASPNTHGTPRARSARMTSGLPSTTVYGQTKRVEGFANRAAHALEAAQHHVTRVRRRRLRLDPPGPPSAATRTSVALSRMVSGDAASVAV